MQLAFFLIFIIINFTRTKYIIKRKPKVLEPNEWGVPQVPALAYNIYPGVEWHTLEQKYNELIPGEDLAQIETMVGKALPMNAKLDGQVKSQITSNANKIKDR